MLIALPASAQPRMDLREAGGRRYGGSERKILPPGARGGALPAPAISLAALPPAEITPVGRFGLPRAGKNRSVPRDALRGSWLVNAGGQWYWTAAVRARGAHGIRLHFRDFDVGSGQVWIRDGDPQNGQSFGPYSGRGTFGDGDFWTGMIFADTVYIEYLAADATTGPPPRLRVAELFHLWRDLAPRDASNVTCFLDEQCYAGNPNIARFSNSVGYMVFSDHTCSGALLNDRNSTGTPYFLSAGHCIADQNDARSMLVIFAFRANACNGTAAFYASYPQVSGADLLARNVHLNSSGDLLTDAPDFAFTRLTAYPNTGTWALGWTTSVSSADVLTSISHPRNLSQRVAVGSIIDRSSAYFYTIRMNQGAIDHGSSGGGIINNNGQLVASTSYVPNTPDVSACDITSRDYGYTRFDAIYPAIQQWMEAPAPPARATMVSPASGSTLAGTSVSFSWTNPAGATGYALAVGSQAGGTDLFAQDFGSATSGTVTGLPADGRTLYVRLTTRSAPGTATADYMYTAYRAPASPPPTLSGVSNAASGADTIAPGSWVSAYGQNLGPSPGRPWSGADIVAGALPVNLAGTRVTVNGKAAAIAYASATQVNFQAPDDTTSGPVPVVITTGAGASQVAYITLRPVAVGIFPFAQKSATGTYAAATHADGSAVLPAGWAAGASPAAPGETISVWGTGCGPSSPARASGYMIPATPLASAVAARIGQAGAAVSYAGLAAPGLCQFNVAVPAGTQGDQSIVLTISGTQSQPGMVIAVSGK